MASSVSMESRLNPIFLTGRTRGAFDPEYGHVRIPQKQIDEKKRRFKRVLEDGGLSLEQRDATVRALEELDHLNDVYDEADAVIKREYGPDHFYGEKGYPTLRGDREAAEIYGAGPQ